MKNKKMMLVCLVVILVVAVLVWWCAVRKNVMLCPNSGATPDKYGCCPGETYTDMGDLGFNCCPEFGDCFPPIK